MFFKWMAAVVVVVVVVVVVAFFYVCVYWELPVVFVLMYVNANPPKPYSYKKGQYRVQFCKLKLSSESRHICILFCCTTSTSTRPTTPKTNKRRQKPASKDFYHPFCEMFSNSILPNPRWKTLKIYGLVNVAAFLAQCMQVWPVNFGRFWLGWR